MKPISNPFNLKTIKGIIIFLALVLTVVSCTKKSSNDDTKTSYFRMKIDGELKEYDSCWVFAFQQSSGSQVYYQWNILAGIPGDYAGISVNDAVPISAKSFSSSMSNIVTTTPMAGLGAYRPSGTDDIYISNQAGWPLYEANITITSIDEKYATGTFSGKMRLVGGSDIKNITEGEFKALK